MQATVPKGLLGAAKLHARIEDIKRSKGAPPWSEKVVVNDQIVGTLICQPSGHKTDTHYHLVDEWWVVLEGEIDWEIEGAEVVRARAGESLVDDRLNVAFIEALRSERLFFRGKSERPAVARAGLHGEVLSTHVIHVREPRVLKRFERQLEFADVSQREVVTRGNARGARFGMDAGSQPLTERQHASARA